MASFSPKRIEFEGPDDAKIMVVGEAPGEWEDRLGRPFVSRPVAKEHGFTIDGYSNTAGDLLERYLGRLGIPRDCVYLANLFKHRPRNNEFKSVVGTPELSKCIEELDDTIKKVNPNVIVAVGGWPTWYLAGKCGKNPKTKKPEPGSGITTYRGSRYPCILPLSAGKKVICTYHPAAVLRNWSVNGIFFFDLQRAVEDAEFPELRYPTYEKFIDPTADDCHRLVNEALGSKVISLDIETFPSRTFSCIGASWRNDEGTDRSLCITFKRKDLWRFAREIWQSDTPKVLQYGTYDITFMRNFYDWRIGGYYNKVGWDTYIAAAELLPDYDRGLDFLTSIHTRFPYYKTERKVWKEKGDMEILWNYNIKDCIATYHIMLEQQEHMAKLFKYKVA